jgi:hypothetical protein
MADRAEHHEIIEGTPLGLGQAARATRAVRARGEDVSHFRNMDGLALCVDE